jgi:hypothetical protein
LSRVQGVDDHLAIDRAGDLDAAVAQVGRQRRHLPVAAAHVPGFAQEVRQPAPVQVSLQARPPGQQLAAPAVEGPVQGGDEVERLGGEEGGTLGGQRGEDFHARRGGGHNRHETPSWLRSEGAPGSEKQLQHKAQKRIAKAD